MARAASFILNMLLVAGVAVFGGSFVPGAWYQEIAKPAWTPPG